LQKLFRAEEGADLVSSIRRLQVRRSLSKMVREFDRTSLVGLLEASAKAEIYPRGNSDRRGLWG
jgi:hypothetical protein